LGEAAARSDPKQVGSTAIVETPLPNEIALAGPEHLDPAYVASTFSWLLEPMIEQAGLEIERADYGSLRIFATYLCAKPRR
jgi:hypothetical protein